LRRNYEQGVVITLVAVVMLFVVGAMAALSIDVVTFYTARSEAQLAADGAALAAARVLANSGATSDPNALSDNLMTNAWALAQAVALRVAEQNQVAGTNLTAANVILPPGPGGTNLPTNPTVTISVQVTNLPTFFARIWGTRFITVSASATAEAYNPSGAGIGQAPVSLTCVKPWLLPNIDPSNPPNPIFSTTTGAINNPALLGWTFSSPGGVPMSPRCPNGNCNNPPPTFTLPTPVVWQYYPGDPATTFPPPTQAIPTCAPAMITQYEKSIAGCIETPIACNSTANIDTSNYGFNRNRETERAVNCLTHANANQGDQVDPMVTSPPFQFLAGNDNPIAGLAGNDVMVSDSLVTVPVFDVNSFNTSGTNFQIVGFVQLFLNPNGVAAPGFPPGNRGKVNTTIINMAGCGTGATGQPILGNGASPVAVRLISPP
jgi:Flp pilus assembly protein TadG